MTWELTVGGSFMVAAIFWAGSTYNRVAAIEASLNDIRALLPALGKVAVLESRLDRLQEEMDDVKRRRA